MQKRHKIFLLLGIELSLIACHPKNFNGRSHLTSRPDMRMKLGSLETYASCEALKQDLRGYIQKDLESRWADAQWYRQHPRPLTESWGGAAESVIMSAGSAAGPAADKSSSAISIGTNIQEHGVDEADEIKMDERLIYIANNQPNAVGLSIAVVQKNPLQERGQISLPQLSGTQLFTRSDRLIVLGSQQGGIAQSGATWKQHLIAKVYDTKGTPKLVHELSSPGNLKASRLIDGKLVLVLQESFTMRQNMPYPSEADLKGDFASFAASVKPESLLSFSEETVESLRCTDIMKISSLNETLTYQKILSYDVEQGQLLSQVVIPGNDFGIYMSEKNLYSYGHPSLESGWWAPDDRPAQASYQQLVQQQQETLVIKKISFDLASGQLKPEAIGSVPGHLKNFDDVWAFHEISSQGSDLLAVVTSEGDLRQEDAAHPATNHMNILQSQEGQLKSVAGIESFGEHEDVRSVRYAGDYAYVVSFKRTDPLFTIDLHEPKAPKIVGELKIPGFSLYLHPASGDRLLGLGLQTEESGEETINRAFFQGILFQLFDVQNPAAAQRVSAVELGKRGSYSEAHQDHHAFYFDPTANIVGFPVALFDDARSSQAPNGQTVHQTLQFSGALLYQLEDKNLRELKRVSHFEFLPPTCRANIQPQISWTSPIPPQSDVRRIFRDGARLYTISNFGVKVLDASTLMDQGSLALKRPDCLPNWNRGQGE